MRIVNQRHEVTAEDCDLSGSQFTNVNLSRAVFDDVNLSGVTVGNADLSGSRFNDCNFSGATIEGVPVADLLAAYRDRAARGEAE